MRWKHRSRGEEKERGEEEGIQILLNEGLSDSIGERDRLKAKDGRVRNGGEG